MARFPVAHKGGILEGNPASAGGEGETFPEVLNSPTPVKTALSIGITGEAQERFTQSTDASMHWSDGTNAPQIQFALDNVNEFNGALGFYPDSSNGTALVAVYGDTVRPAGTGDGPVAFATARASYSAFDVQGSTTSNHHTLPEVVMFSDTANSLGGVRAFGPTTTSDLGAEASVLAIHNDNQSPNHWAGLVQIIDGAGDSSNAAGRVAFKVSRQENTGFPQFAVNYDGSLHWGVGTNQLGDTYLQRSAGGVLEIPQHGGGLKLTSPDGTQTKQIQLSNGGALVLV